MTSNKTKRKNMKKFEENVIYVKVNCKYIYLKLKTKPMNKYGMLKENLRKVLTNKKEEYRTEQKEPRRK